uniref:PH domain-containing protein n=1 Tax=Wuchereria bancrofti TaxID=6293 RepID=A0A1I8F054_WUCBA
MSEQREIVKASWLQHVVHKKGGTLHRKTKILYEEGKWVVLCVHSGRIPLLEWYFSEEYVHGHRPSKVIDLLDSSFVRVVMSDPSRRSFMIGFVDCSRDAIELSALTIEDCDDWIRSTTSALMRLKCLTESANLYISVPDFASESLRATEQFLHEDAGRNEVPEEVTPSLTISPARNSNHERIRFSPSTQLFGISHLPRTLSAEEKKVKNHRVMKTPPPLPPRNISSSEVQVLKTSAERCSIYDHPKNRTSMSFGDSSVVEERAEDVSVNPGNSITLEELTSLDTEITTPVSLYSESVKRGYSVPTGTLNASIAHSRRITGSNSFSLDYDSPSGAISRIFPITNISLQKTHSTCKGNSSGMLAEEHDQSQITNNSGISSGLRNLTVQPFICMQHIAYVDFGGRVWSVFRCPFFVPEFLITGWTAIAEKYLTDQLFIGDQLLRIADVDIYSAQQIPLIFGATFKTGFSVNIAIQRVPYGTIYTLQKTTQKFDTGLMLDKRKNKLADVLEGSPAWKAGIRPLVPAVTRTGTTPACITCVNRHGLNIFSKNDEVLRQIDTLPLSIFTVMVQPYDFVKLLKRSLKKLKNVSDFVH